jgi:hypothetical protein
LGRWPRPAAVATTETFAPAVWAHLAVGPATAELAEKAFQRVSFREIFETAVTTKELGAVIRSRFNLGLDADADDSWRYLLHDIGEARHLGRRLNIHCFCVNGRYARSDGAESNSARDGNRSCGSGEPTVEFRRNTGGGCHVNLSSGCRTRRGEHS